MIYWQAYDPTLTVDLTGIPSYTLSYYTGGLQYLATAYSADGSVLSRAQCQLVNGSANTAPVENAPLPRLYFFTGLPFAYAFPDAWWSDDYTALLKIDPACESALGVGKTARRYRVCGVGCGVK